MSTENLAGGTERQWLTYSLTGLERVRERKEGGIYLGKEGAFVAGCGECQPGN